MYSFGSSGIEVAGFFGVVIFRCVLSLGFIDFVDEIARQIRRSLYGLISEVRISLGHTGVFVGEKLLQRIEIHLPTRRQHGSVHMTKTVKRPGSMLFRSASRRASALIRSMVESACGVPSSDSQATPSASGTSSHSNGL